MIVSFWGVKRPIFMGNSLLVLGRVYTFVVSFKQVEGLTKGVIKVG